MRLSVGRTSAIASRRSRSSSVRRASGARSCSASRILSIAISASSGVLSQVRPDSSQSFGPRWPCSARKRSNRSQNVAASGMSCRRARRPSTPWSNAAATGACRAHQRGQRVQLARVLRRAHAAGGAHQVRDQPGLAGSDARVDQDPGHDRRQRRGRHVVGEHALERRRTWRACTSSRTSSGASSAGRRATNSSAAAKLSATTSGSWRCLSAPSTVFRILSEASRLRSPLRGDVRRRVALAEERDVDRLRRRPWCTHAHHPQVRQIEVSVAAVQADDHRGVRAEVVRTQDADTGVRTAARRARR